MSANIQTRDVQVGIEMAWHKLTHVKPSIDRDNCEIIYPMHKENLTTTQGVPTEFFIVVSDDDNKPIGSPVGPDYSLINNGMIWDMAQSALAGTSHEIVSCGTVGNRSKGFISVKLSKEFVAAGRTTQDVLNILWGHGGKMSVIARTGLTVVFCQNTFNMALGAKGDFNFNVRHTGSAMTKLDGMSKAIDAHIGVVSEFQAAMKALVSNPISHSLARQIFAGFIVRDEKLPDEISTRTENQIDDLHTLFRAGKGNTGKDASDVFNAVTDYYTHSSSGGENRFKQIESSEFGMGNRRKSEMYELLLGHPVAGLGDLQSTIARGDRVLQLV